MDDFKEKLASWADSDNLEKAAIDMGDAMIGALAAGGGGAAGGGIGGVARMMLPLVALRPFEPAAGTMGYLMNKGVFDGFGGLLNRINADETAAKRVVDELSKAVATRALSGVDSVMAGAKERTRSPVRRAIMTRLAKEDDIISQANPADMLQAYSTMSKVAPTLSTDINAVKSFLRSSAMHSEGGIDPLTIKGLAEAETAMTGRWKK